MGGGVPREEFLHYWTVGDEAPAYLGLIAGIVEGRNGQLSLGYRRPEAEDWDRLWRPDGFHAVTTHHLARVVRAARDLLTRYVELDTGGLEQRYFADLSEALFGPEHGWTQELRR